MATHLARTCDATSASGYSLKWTWSGWVKRSKLGAEQGIMGNKRDDNNVNSRFKLYFRSTDKLGWECKDSTGSDDSSFESNMLFRDTNAWYHIVLIYDTNNSTATERIKCYVNGKDLRTELGGFSSDDQASSGFGTLWSSAVANYLGTSGNNSGIAMQFEGCMSHCHLTYGYRYEASTFGSFDSTTGEWKINTSPSVTYGSQGYFLLKNDNSVTDQSGQSNNYTATGTLTKTEDNPSNVFCTMTMGGAAGSYQLSNGNLTCSGNSNNSWKYAFVGQVGANAGKYYWEVKLITCNSHNITGVIRSDKVWTNATLYSGGGWNGVQSSTSAGGLGIYSQTNASMGGALYIGGSSVTLTTNDIVMYALDLDNKKMWVGKNGVWADDGSSGNTGNPSTGAYPLWGTGEFTTGAHYLPASSIYYTNSHTYNFGNGYFGTTAVSSAGTNASNIGIFEYNVPTGFTAWSTKGLNE